MTEMCHAMFYPIIQVRKGLEAEEEVEWAFEVALGGYMADNKNTTIYLGKQSRV